MFPYAEVVGNCPGRGQGVHHSQAEGISRDAPLPAGKRMVGPYQRSL